MKPAPPLGPRLVLAAGLLLALGLLVYGVVSARSCARPAECPRVLFVGNSHTFQNDLPGTLVALAASGGHTVEASMVAEGGWRLADHAASGRTRDAIAAAPWDYVVLQEQSQLPSVERLRAEEMYPAARALARRVAEAGARPIFFMTWARRDGWPEQGLAGYEPMQREVSRGYLGIARELRAPVAPVGVAWLQARRSLPGLALWIEDGSHAAPPGTYLAACVFYAALFGESPEGLGYHGGLPPDTAGALQRIAAEVVLERPQQWGLP